MIASQLPTSADIYLELNGKKMAVVQSYAAQTTKDLISYYYGLETKEEIVDGLADTPEAGVTMNEI